MDEEVLTGRFLDSACVGHTYYTESRSGVTNAGQQTGVSWTIGVNISLDEQLIEYPSLSCCGYPFF